MTSPVPFFYDQQIRRFILQFIRLFSNFQVQYGKDRDGNIIYKTVPIKYGDATRQAAAIVRNNSENTIPTVPQMAAYVATLRYDRDRVQNPTYVSKMNIRERAWDAENEEYLQTQGNAFTIARLMPVPYTLTMKLDIWTSSTEQKLQAMEQILCLFNPDLEIQSTDNYVDWTSLSLVRLIDTNWSSRSIPVGADDAIDVATLTFEIPIWISSPVQVKKLGVIQKIISGLYDAQGNLNPENIEDWMMLGDRISVSPLNYGVMLSGNQLILLKYEDIVANSNEPVNPLSKIGTPDAWKAFVNMYGSLTGGISQVRLLLSDGESEVIGTVAYHPSDESILLFTVDIDTIPTNTLGPVNAIVDPQAMGPGAGLPAAILGHRYLLTNDIGDVGNASGAAAWRGAVDLVANTNDIVEYNGTNWIVAFDASEETSIEYVSNLATTIQYKWTGSRWIRSYEGEYRGNRWTLVL